MQTAMQPYIIHSYIDSIYVVESDNLMILVDSGKY